MIKPCICPKADSIMPHEDLENFDHLVCRSIEQKHRDLETLDIWRACVVFRSNRGLPTRRDVLPERVEKLVSVEDVALTLG